MHRPTYGCHHKTYYLFPSWMLTFGYNQIWIYGPDSKMKSFMTNRGLFLYKFMSFGLKNDGAIYQRKYIMKLNLNMFVFGVGSGNFLGFLINQRGINSNLEKIKELIYIYMKEV